MVEAGLLGAVALAAGAGVGTFFSPCAYALLPGYVGYYVAATGADRPPLSGTAARGLAAAAGAVLTLSVLAAVAAAAGRVVGRVLPAIELLVGVALVVLGAALAADRGPRLRVALPRRRATVLGFVAFGALYALAAAGCVAPLFLALAFEAATLRPAETAAVLAAYAGTFGALVLGVTVATAGGHGVGVERVAPRAERIVRIGSVVLVVAGLVQVYLALGGA